MESRLLLNIVVRQSPSILQLFASEDQSLLIGRDAFLVLDLCLHIINGVRWLNLQCNCLASKGLNKNLHSSSQSQHQVERRFLLNVVIRQRPSCNATSNCFTVSIHLLSMMASAELIPPSPIPVYTIATSNN